MTTSLESRAGAFPDPSGTRFTLRSWHATAVELCLFEPGEERERRRVPLEAVGDGVWTVHAEGVRAGQLYGYRVHGPWEPERGMRFNPHKLLVDPAARAIAGELVWHDLLVGHRAGLPQLRSEEDSAAVVPRSLVCDDSFDWQGVERPAIAWRDTVIYECHVKGMTWRHPDVSTERRGRYLGLCTPGIVEHLRSLGITTLSLLPVQHHAQDDHVARIGLTNYWGYATLGFFAPDARFASGSSGEQVREFKEMVRELHRAGIEVLLDVVYNHTPEGTEEGGTMSLRGIDSCSYYRHDPLDPGSCLDWTGCGNTLDFGRPAARLLALESLRYWAEEMRVDGFRFDLAPVLGRDPEAFQTEAAFFRELRADPVLSSLKLVAEPWDLGPDGYAFGRFPSGWAQWNGEYRDGVRSFWRKEGGEPRDLVEAIAGSPRTFGSDGPERSVNFVSCHDGFTLLDQVSYSERHNEANGEGGTDGHQDNRSCNWGVEGPTDDRTIIAARDRARRNHIAMLAFSRGVPMLSHGDELGRTQHGNNNAYCHDGELTWLRWELDGRAEDFLEFVRAAFRQRAHSATDGDLVFFDVTGVRLPLQAPATTESAPPAVVAVRPAGARTEGLVINGCLEPASFQLPAELRACRPVLSTSGTPECADEGVIEVPAHGVVWLAPG